MREYRDRSEILAKLTRVCGTPKLSTHVMFEVKLSYSQLHAYLNEAIDLGLIQYKDPFYSITTKGKEFLEQWKVLQEIIGVTPD